jgi:hypothetical protein
MQGEDGGRMLSSQNEFGSGQGAGDRRNDVASQEQKVQPQAIFLGCSGNNAKFVNSRYHSKALRLGIGFAFLFFFYAYRNSTNPHTFTSSILSC